MQTTARNLADYLTNFVKLGTVITYHIAFLPFFASAPDLAYLPVAGKGFEQYYKVNYNKLL